MLRHCPFPRFSSGARRKMPNVAFGKEKTSSHVLLENQPLDRTDPKDVAKEPPQKVLKIFSINIIAQSFCRRRVSIVRIRPVIRVGFGWATEHTNVKGHLSPLSRKLLLFVLFYQSVKSKLKLLGCFYSMFCQHSETFTFTTVNEPFSVLLNFKVRQINVKSPANKQISRISSFFFNEAMFEFKTELKTLVIM